MEMILESGLSKSSGFGKVHKERPTQLYYY